MKFTSEHDQLRKLVREVVETEINPNVDRWEADAAVSGARAVSKARCARPARP